MVGRGERGAWGRGKGVFDKTSSGERVEGEGNGGKGSGKRLLEGETWDGKKTGKLQSTIRFATSAPLSS